MVGMGWVSGIFLEKPAGVQSQALELTGRGSSLALSLGIDNIVSISYAFLFPGLFLTLCLVQILLPSLSPQGENI